MRNSTLTERLERSRAEIAAAERNRNIETQPSQTSESQLLTQVAEALSAATTAASARKPAVVVTADGVAKAAPPDLPLMLAGRTAGPAVIAVEPARPRRVEWRQLAAPVLLAGSLVGVVMLMSTGFSEQPRPKLTRLPTAEIASPLVATSPSEPILLDQVIATTEDLKLLEHCETLITQGEIRAAREELARAAASGSTQARFALAETFDPNVLAAWGLREDVADASVARVLYQQALAAGDNRATSRLSALK